MYPEVSLSLFQLLVDMSLHFAQHTCKDDRENGTEGGRPEER